MIDPVGFKRIVGEKYKEALPCRFVGVIYFIMLTLVDTVSCDRTPGRDSAWFIIQRVGVDHRVPVPEAPSARVRHACSRWWSRWVPELSVCRGPP